MDTNICHACFVLQNSNIAEDGHLFGHTKLCVLVAVLLEVYNDISWKGTIQCCRIYHGHIQPSIR